MRNISSIICSPSVLYIQLVNASYFWYLVSSEEVYWFLWLYKNRDTRSHDLCLFRLQCVHIPLRFRLRFWWYLADNFWFSFKHSRWWSLSVYFWRIHSQHKLSMSAPALVCFPVLIAWDNRFLSFCNHQNSAWHPARRLNPDSARIISETKFRVQGYGEFFCRCCLKGHWLHRTCAVIFGH